MSAANQLPAAMTVVDLHRSIETSALVCTARRWLPCNPLPAHAMRAKDTIRRR
jgi:hypothetical protein